MTDKEISEGKELIANFMEWSISKSGKTYRPHGSYSSPYRIRNIKFDSSWDWIMPACSKWDNLYFDVLEIKTREEYELRCDSLDNAVTRYELAPVFKQLVENIKWYNKNKTDESK